MKKLIAIGEALIDFAPSETGKEIKNVSSFIPNVGGAPANVCGAFSHLGGRAALITQLGNDPFGDKIIDELERCSIDISCIKRTNEANTSLSFVALKEDGGREFTFYRKPGADMLLSPEDVKDEWFEDAGILHFCSVSLGDFPMKKAHEAAIEKARDRGMMISFDPNLRFNLWDDKDALKAAVHEFIPKADILKLSDEELFFVTGEEKIKDALPKLFEKGVSLVIYTEGKNGASAYTKNTSAFSAIEKHVKAVDTTGAGDGFIGSFLWQLLSKEIDKSHLSGIEEQKLQKMVEFSNEFCLRSVQKMGAISSYPTKQEMEEI